MKEHPILFSTPMVQAILDGRKTQTRRVILNARPSDGFPLGKWKGYCPYGQVGDKLWVRETWATINCYDDTKPSELPHTVPFWFCDTNGDDPTGCGDDKGKTRPSIFLPRWASRITLAITEIRVHRLQDISGKDAIAEGCGDIGIVPINTAMMLTNTKTIKDCHRALAANLFNERWDSINGEKYPWERNPWVWAISFKVVK